MQTKTRPIESNKRTQPSKVLNKCHKPTTKMAGSDSAIRTATVIKCYAPAVTWRNTIYCVPIIVSIVIYGTLIFCLVLKIYNLLSNSLWRLLGQSKAIKVVVFDYILICYTKMENGYFINILVFIL